VAEGSFMPLLLPRNNRIVAEEDEERTAVDVRIHADVTEGSF